MYQHDHWRPTKYVERNGRWNASRDVGEVGISARIIADLVVQFSGRSIGQHASGRLLDLGCGKAPLLGLYKPHVTEIVTMDWAQSHGAEFVDICHDLTQPLPLEDQSFDTVLLSDVLEHLPEPLALLKEIRRILKPGGKLLLNVPFFYGLHEVPHDYFRYTRFGLEDMAAKAQMQVVSLQPIGGAPDVLFDLVGNILFGRKLIGHAAKLLSPLHKMLSHLGAFRRFSVGTAESYPLGYGMIMERTQP